MAQSRASSGGKFQFWYIGEPDVVAGGLQLTKDAAGKRVETVSEAMIRLDPVDFITLRKIEFLDAQRSHAFVTQLRLVDSDAIVRLGHNTLFAFLEEETAPPGCSKFGATSQAFDGAKSSTRTKPAKPALEATATLTSDNDWVEPRGTSAYLTDRTVWNNESKTLSLDISTNMSADSPSITEATLRRLGSCSTSHESLARQPVPKAGRAAPRLSSHVQPAHPLAESSTSTDNLNIPDFDPAKGLIFPAGSYEIILVLDTREIESKSNRDRFSEKLADKGVKLETRALRLGDVCWIAKRLDGYGGEEDECVLDYVLERKRLDDLCSSMRDGRYHEQCVSCVLGMVDARLTAVPAGQFWHRQRVLSHRRLANHASHGVFRSADHDGQITNPGAQPIQLEGNQKAVRIHRLSGDHDGSHQEKAGEYRHTCHTYTVSLPVVISASSCPSHGFRP